MEESQKYQLNKKDLLKIAKGLGVAIAGAALTYVSSAIANVDFGVYTPLVVAGWSVLANVARKFVFDNTQEE